MLDRCPATRKSTQQRRVHARLHARKVDLKSMPCFGEMDLAKTMICLVRNTILNLKSMPCYWEVDSKRLAHVRLHARLHARNVDLKSMPCSGEVDFAKIMICLVCDTIFDLKSMPCFKEVDSAKTSPCQTARTRSRLGELVPLGRGELHWKSPPKGLAEFDIWSCDGCLATNMCVWTFNLVARLMLDKHF